ncbi:MAG TPA: glycosyltransferase family 1 protein [Noviherbaspirillum sp.]
MQSLIVFSHLRWNFVFQRPQHLLSRLARHYRVLFIEEPAPISDAASQDFHLSNPLPNLTVCTPLAAGGPFGFDEVQLPLLRRVVAACTEDYADPVVWFYTPMALPLLEELQPRAVVYDCMDELSAFKNAPPRLIALEDELLAVADIVFTGGPSLYNAKKDRHHNVHCFPSSVDAKHFRQARDKTFAHPSQQSLPHPRLGFYGVIDERFDTELLRHIAMQRPDWQFVLVGPVVKIDPAVLPKADNIHYMGQQPYSALPQFLAAWDVCLMPFALNESTRFISPTKSLEYMAAELPIVSTPVRDVVDLHADVVEIARTADEFVAACERALALSQDERLAMCRVMRDKLSRTSWDFTAARMHELLEEFEPALMPGLQGITVSNTATGFGHAGR